MSEHFSLINIAEINMYIYIYIILNILQLSYKTGITFKNSMCMFLHLFSRKEFNVAEWFLPNNDVIREYIKYLPAIIRIINEND